MGQPAVESQKADPEALRALVDEYIDYHAGVENFVAAFGIEYWLLRRLGIEPRSWPGRLAGGVIHLLIVLLPALILTALTGQWADAPLFTWAIVAAAWGGMGLCGTPLYRFSISNLLCWLGTVVDEADLRRLLAWQYRRFNHRAITPVSAVLTMSLVVPLLLVLHSSGTPVLVGTLYIGVFLFFTIMQNACAMVMVPFEAHNLSTCRYELYSLSPADTVAVRESLRGYKQLGGVNVVVVTLMILLFLILLPGGSRLVIPIVVSLLLLELLYTALGSLAPRLVLGRIIQTRKEEEMAVLQGWLDEFAPRIRELTGLEYEEMKRLQETQDAIRNSPENLLPLGAILRTAGALLLSVLTVLVSVLAQEWIAGLVDRLAP